MKKIGVLTFYYDSVNIGGLLQSFALPYILNKEFHIQAEQIRYSEKIENSSEQMNQQKNNVIYQLGIQFFSMITLKNRKIREKAFYKFINEIPHSSGVFFHHTVENSLINYDTVMCGGDQIWNSELVREHLDVYTLQFVKDDRKKIAYAPSVAISSLSEKSQICMARGLSNLNYISLRERSNLGIVQRLTDKQISIVVDPVLLLTESEWLEQARPVRIKEKYIFCYLLGDDIKQRRVIEKLAKKLKLKILTLPHILFNKVRKCDLFFGNIRDYSSGPREFLTLIRNAEMVVTDSFHACVFSMIFKTPFIVFERNKPNEKGNMNSRIYDFLEEYHLDKQLVDEKCVKQMNGLPEIDYTFAHDHWKQRREESLRYLRNALQDIGNGELT